MSNVDTLKTFDLTTLPDLDVVVLGALEMLEATPQPPTSVPFHRPLVIGSGNALSTGKIIFGEHDAVFADESNYETILAKTPNIDGVVIVSASGSKHSIAIAEKIKEKALTSVLFTNNPEAPASKFFAPDDIRIFPKNREPYTYNASTYLSMIIGDTSERAGEIGRFIKEEVEPKLVYDFGSWTAFTFIIPTEFAELKAMLRTKFDELFGSKLVGRFFTPEEIKHAKTVVPNEHELFIAIGTNNDTYGNEESRLSLPLPKNSTYASALAVTYYLIGKIQKAHPPYFKQNIAKYCQQTSEIFNQPINPIVD